MLSIVREQRPIVLEIDTSPGKKSSVDVNPMRGKEDDRHADDPEYSDGPGAMFDDSPDDDPSDRAHVDIVCAHTIP